MGSFTVNRYEHLFMAEIYGLCGQSAGKKDHVVLLSVGGAGYLLFTVTGGLGVLL